MAYTQEEINLIRNNWTQLRDAIVSNNINMQQAAKNPKSDDLRRLQILIRAFIIRVMREQHGEQIFAGDVSNGDRNDLVDFRGGHASINQKKYLNKEEFLREHAADGTWAEDLMLSAGFDALGILPIYHYLEEGDRIDFMRSEAISVAHLTCISRGHWVRRGQQNPGGGNCGYYSVAQEVAAIWPRVTKWLDNGDLPFRPTAGELAGLITRNQEGENIDADTNLFASLLEPMSFEMLLSFYVSQAGTPSERSGVTYLRNALLVKREEIPDALRMLVLSSLSSNSFVIPQGFSEAQARPILINVLARYLQIEGDNGMMMLHQFLNPVEEMSPEVQQFQPAPAPVTVTKPYTPAYVKPVDEKLQQRYDRAMALFKQDDWELPALQLVYEKAAEELGFKTDPGNSSVDTMMVALANECKTNPELFRRLNFFLTKVNPKDQSTQVMSP